VAEDVHSAITERMFADALEFARQGIRATFILNGGAILALLTFLGDVHRDPSSVSLVWGIKHAFPYFVIGVFLSALSLPIAFLAQEKFVDVRIGSSNLAILARQYVSQAQPAQQSTKGDFERMRDELQNYINHRNRGATRLRNAAIVCIVGSLGCFILGAGFAYCGF
jgi:hypothetical protein